MENLSTATYKQPRDEHVFRDKTNQVLTASDQTSAFKKREDFAVSLRKQSKQKLILAKRRKLTQAYNQYRRSGGAQPSESCSYSGFPEWREDKYRQQEVLLDRVFFISF
jgi:hypothetical protein